jgi:hypothetical protein
MAQAAWAGAGGYTSGMDCASDADRPTPPSSDPLAEQDEHLESPETFGAIGLTRHVKDDGRALILYSYRRADDETEGRGA